MILDESDRCSMYDPMELDKSQLTSVNMSMRKSFGSIRTESINEDISQQKKLSIVDILTRERLGKK
jgi:hypothetical protein